MMRGIWPFISQCRSFGRFSLNTGKKKKDLRIYEGRFLRHVPFDPYGCLFVFLDMIG